MELTDRIACFLDTGKVKKPVSKGKKAEKAADTGELFEDTIIESGFVCSEKHRAFFKKRIGKNFSFNVLFQKWLKENAGKTYRDAIEAYYRIQAEKKERQGDFERICGPAIPRRENL